MINYPGFTGNWSCLADFLLLQGVDDGALPDVGIPNETYADVLLVFMEVVELKRQLCDIVIGYIVYLRRGMYLFQNLNQRTLSKGVVNTCVVTDGGVLFRKDSLPFSCD